MPPKSHLGQLNLDKSILFETPRNGGFGLPKEPELFVEIVEKIADISTRTELALVLKERRWDNETLREIRDLTLNHYGHVERKQFEIIGTLVWKLLICTKGTLIEKYNDGRRKYHLIENFEQFLWTERYGKMSDLYELNRDIKTELGGYFNTVWDIIHNREDENIGSSVRIEDPWLHGDHWANAINHIVEGASDEDEIKKSFKDVKSGFKNIMPNVNSSNRNRFWKAHWECLEMGSEEIIPTMTYNEWRAHLIEYLAEKDDAEGEDNHWHEIIPKREDWDNDLSRLR